MAGERQTEPHQAETWLALKDVMETQRFRAEQAEAELARVRAERDEAREKLDNLKFRSDQVGYVSGLLERAETAEYELARLRGRDEARTDAAEIRATARAENQAAEIVVLIRSYANVHMTKALADLIEHKYIHGEERST